MSGELSKKELEEMVIQSIAESQEIQSMIKNAARDVTWRADWEKKENERKAGYDARIRYLKQLFERYREAEPDGGVQKCIDSLVRVHKKCAEPGEAYRRRHNAMILRYLVEVPLSDKEICKKTGITPTSLENIIDKALEEMAISFFGVEMLNFIA